MENKVVLWLTDVPDLLRDPPLLLQLGCIQRASTLQKHDLL